MWSSLACPPCAPCANTRRWLGTGGIVISRLSKGSRSWYVNDATGKTSKRAGGCRLRLGLMRLTSNNWGIKKKKGGGHHSMTRRHLLEFAVLWNPRVTSMPKECNRSGDHSQKLYTSFTVWDAMNAVTEDAARTVCRHYGCPLDTTKDKLDITG